jgi:hypothetical protein
MDRYTLEQQIASLFSDNNAGEITPQRLRDVMSNILASVDLKGEVASGGGTPLRWVPLATGTITELSVASLPIASSMVLSSVDGGAEVSFYDATTINKIDMPVSIQVKNGEAILINRVSEFEILAHALTYPTIR